MLWEDLRWSASQCHRCSFNPPANTAGPELLADEGRGNGSVAGLRAGGEDSKKPRPQRSSECDLTCRCGTMFALCTCSHVGLLNISFPAQMLRCGRVVADREGVILSAQNQVCVQQLWSLSHITEDDPSSR